MKNYDKIDNTYDEFLDNLSRTLLESLEIGKNTLTKIDKQNEQITKCNEVEDNIDNDLNETNLTLHNMNWLNWIKSYFSKLKFNPFKIFYKNTNSNNSNKTNKNQFICPECFNDFIQPINLIKHFYKTHENSKMTDILIQTYELKDISTTISDGLNTSNNLTDDLNKKNYNNYKNIIKNNNDIDFKLM